MRRLCLCVILLMGAGCRPAVEPAQTISLATFPREQVMRADEWRWAWRVPGGTTKRVDLGIPGSTGTHAAVRLAILPRGTDNQPLRADVYVGDKHVAAVETTDPAAWLDRRIECGGEAGGKTVAVQFRCVRDFYVHACDLVAGTPAKPNILIVAVDALRPDHLQCYGYGRETSPHIDKIAAESVRFSMCIAQASWTRPSVASLFTGCYPGAHGAADRDSVARTNLPTMGGMLAQAGYVTETFFGNATCLPVWGIGDEFDRFVYVSPHGAPKVNDGEILDQVMAAIEQAAGRPWFIYVHLVGTHNPYQPPEPYAAKFKSGGDQQSPAQQLIDLYDAELAHTDAQIGRFVDKLRAHGIYDATLFMLIADHGEQFYEHGLYGHGQSLHAEEVRVPLIMKLPQSALAGKVVDVLVEMVDIAPSMVEFAGLPPHARFQGQSFLALLTGDDHHKPFAYASLQLEQKSMYMAQSRNAKFIRDLVTGQRLWFDLNQDPDEQHPLAETQAAALPDAAHLEMHANRVAALESQGLNILITTGSAEIDTVTGRVAAKGLADGIVHYHADHSSLQCRPDAAEFTIRFADHRGMMGGSEQWHDVVQQESARILLTLDESSEIAIELVADGQPVPVSDIFLGPVARKSHPDGWPIIPANLLADPREFDPLLLERRFAVYVFYVPQTARLKDEELSPAIRDALEAFGYLK